MERGAGEWGGGQGDQQIIVKLGPNKPKLENLTFSQWSIANLAILYKLVSDNKLSGPSMLDYLSYTTKVYQLVQRFSLHSVSLYDRNIVNIMPLKGLGGGQTSSTYTRCAFRPAINRPRMAART